MADFTPFDIECYSRLKERFEFLFEPELLNEICQNGRLSKYITNQTILNIGDQLTHVPIVIDGSIKVMTEDEAGDELLLYYLELGETCAVTLNCCTSTSKSTIKAIAETDTELLFIPIHRMEDWMIRFSTWRRYVLDSYHQRFNEMITAIDTIVFKSLEERIKKYLTDKAWIVKDKAIEISHAEIAQDLHSSRVAVSRIMKKLEQVNFLSQQRNKVTLRQL